MKNRNFLLLGLIIILTAQISGCALPTVSGSNQKNARQVSKENTYQQLVAKIKETDWTKATSADWESTEGLIKELNDFKYTPVLARYVYYQKYLAKDDINNAIGVANYIPEDYFGELRDQIMQVKADAKILAKNQDMKHYQELFLKGDYATIRKETVAKASIDNDYAAIYNYLSALDYQNQHLRSAMAVSLSHINLPNQGFLSEEITKMINQNATEIEHMRTLLSGKTSAAKLDPIIGMTTKEVLASSWGSPREMISTAGNEQQVQWEYPNNRVIFLGHGFVTAIQY